MFYYGKLKNKIDLMQDIIIYNTEVSKTRISLIANNGMVWMNQNQLAELFATSLSNISMHISIILNE